MFLSRFRSSAPTYKVPQSFALDWLARAHARLSTEEASRFGKLLSRYGCGPDKIESRYSYLRDFSHDRWDEMQIFRPDRGEVSIDERLAFYNEILARPVADLYADARPDFDSFIHVTCTGYSSPSLVQSLISQKGWGGEVEALHAYHMGCYASLPAIRMARGSRSVAEILHTELCTLHFDPANHDPEQLVIQSLFADGLIRYRASHAQEDEGFEVTAMKEIIAPDSLRHMTWDLSRQGFRMTLSRDVPKAVQGAIADLVRPWRSSSAVYAIHPGGPRIIDAVKEALELSEEQVAFSRAVLRDHGNMSSATLPHVWARMLPELPVGTPVISMAFGPGLTLSTSQMRRV